MWLQNRCHKLITFPSVSKTCISGNPQPDDCDALDLGPIDLRNLDPATARRMLEDIKSGADIKVMITADGRPDIVHHN